jgi:ribosomal protein L11 methyltransferase
MKYLEITIHTLDNGLETLTDFLEKRGIEGTWIESTAVMDDILEKKNPYDWDYIDDDLLKHREEESRIKFYLEDSISSRNLLKEIKIDLMKLKSDELYARLGQRIQFGRLYLEESLVDDENWKENWSEHFKQVKLTDALDVKSTLAYPDAVPDEHTIVLDPGMAFGTGTHETTALCASLMEKYQCKGKIVLDIGCGSGILSIAAARLGSHKVIGVDIDPIAVETAHENVMRNQCTSWVTILEGDLTKGLNLKAQIVVANLVAEAIVELASSVKPCLADGGIFISSGILVEKKAAVVSALNQQGFEILEILEKGDWCAIAAQ